jgi:hypothetical protein
MATDARGHTVPAATDVPSRNTILNALLSVKDITPVTNTTTRASTSTAVSPSATNPLLVARADARADSFLEFTKDGSTWLSVPLSTGVVTYTPVLNADTTAPTLGTGSTVAGLYCQNGQQMQGHIDIVGGSAATAVGNGLYNVSFPVAMHASLASGSVVGSGLYFDASVSTWRPFVLRSLTSTTARLQDSETSNTAIGHTNPGWGVNDRVHANFSYIVA